MHFSCHPLPLRPSSVSLREPASPEGKLFAEKLDENGNVILNTLNYGNFISAIINFLILALVVFFLVKGLNKLSELGKKKEEKAKAEEPPKEPEPTKEELLLTEIRDLLKEK